MSLTSYWSRVSRTSEAVPADAKKLDASQLHHVHHLKGWYLHPRKVFYTLCCAEVRCISTHYFRHNYGVFVGFMFHTARAAIL
jgi:hypothetical protein